MDRRELLVTFTSGQVIDARYETSIRERPGSSVLTLIVPLDSSVILSGSAESGLVWPNSTVTRFSRARTSCSMRQITGGPGGSLFFNGANAGRSPIGPPGSSGKTSADPSRSIGILPAKRGAQV